MMQNIVEKKDSLQSWIACLLSLCVNLIVGGVASSFGIIVPSLQMYYSENASLVSFVGSLNIGMVYILDPIAAWLFLKVGLRTTFMVGSLVASIASVASIFSPNVQTMIVLYGFFGGTGLALIEVMAVIACDTSFVKRRAMASSIARGGIGLGQILLPPIVNILLTYYEWQVVIFIFGGLFLLPLWFGIIMMIWDYITKKNMRTSCEDQSKLIDIIHSDLMLTEPYLDSIRRLKELNLDLIKESKENYSGNQESPDINDDIAMLMHAEKCQKEDSYNYWQLDSLQSPNNLERIYFNTTIKPNEDMYYNEDYVQPSKSLWSKCITTIRSSLLYNPVFFFVMVGKFFGAISYFTNGVLLASMLLEKGFTLTEASNLVSVNGATGILGAILLGILTDRTKFNALTVSCFSMIFMSLTLFAVTYSNQYELLWLFCICNGFVKNGFMSLGSVLLFDIVPYDSYTTAIGYTGVFMGIGTIAGPPFTGYFYTISQNYTITFCIAAGSALLCGILYSTANVLNMRKTK